MYDSSDFKHFQNMISHLTKLHT